MQILIAEADEPSRSMLQVLLESWGYQTVLAKDGNEVWKIITGTEAPELMLLDWEMPGCSGLELCQKIRANLAERPPYLMLLTARDNIDDIALGLDSGANDYIAKPFTEAILSARIRVGARVMSTQQKLLDANNKLKELNDNLQHANGLLAHMSATDPLTKIANRRSLFECMVRELKRGRREKHPLSAILIDVDFFKKYNDHYGHLMGDECLIKVAYALKNILRRPIDFIARYGGEEFIYILPNTDESGAVKIAQAALDAVKELNIEHNKSDCSTIVSISLGVTTQKPTELEDEKSLTEEADRALYKAKDSGRNKYVVFTKC